jgi:hypothetical protein
MAGGCEPQRHKQALPPKAFGADPSGKILRDRDLSVALARDAEAVEDCARRVGAVEGVKVNSRNVVIQKIVELSPCVYPHLRSD